MYSLFSLSRVPATCAIALLSPVYRCFYLYARALVIQTSFQARQDSFDLLTTPTLSSVGGQETR